MVEGVNNLKHPHVVLSLRGGDWGGGGVKWETVEIFYFVVVTATNNSGSEIGKRLERGITFREKRGVTRVYFLANSKGGMMIASDLEMDILGRIAKIQQRYLELIRPGLEVHEKY